MKFAIFFILISFSHVSFAEKTNLISGNYSIYNINTGTLAYVADKKYDSYVYSLPAYYVDKYASEITDLEKANWIIKESSYGSGRYTLKNKYSGLCLTFYGIGYQTTQTGCSNQNENQQWNIVQNTTNKGGFSMVASSDDSVCLYSWPGDTDYYMYTDACATYKNLSDWTFITTITRGYYNP